MLLWSCDRELQRAFENAGPNKAELKSVIRHYRGDKEKTDAAKYLIRSAQYHGFVDTSDVQVLTGAYLIENIDSAFAAWKDSPYLQCLSYEEFCECVLPYKAFAGQRVDDWKHRLRQREWSCLESNVRQIDALRWEPNNALNALRRVLPDSYEILSQDGCYGTAEILNLFGRANGLPVVVDFVPAWPKTNGYHCWNKCYYINDKASFKETTRYAKVFRKTFAPNPQLLAYQNEVGNIPSSFHDMFCRDVTAEYTRTSSVSIPVNGAGKFAFLAVFNNDEWAPVDICEVKRRIARFDNVGRDVLYCVGYFDEYGIFKPAATPFYLDLKGEISCFDPWSESLTNVWLSRKFHALSHVTNTIKAIHGPSYVVASNDKTFNDKVDTLAVISEASVFCGEIELSASKPYRYYRLCSNLSSRTDFSEIIFKKGHMIMHPMCSASNINDGDQLTNSGVDRTHPVDFDMNRPETITSVIYYRRGDGNCVFPGEEYELYFWNTGGWTLWDNVVAESCWVVSDNVPSGALLYIKDISSGDQNGVFLWDESGKCPRWL